MNGYPARLMGTRISFSKMGLRRLSAAQYGQLSELYTIIGNETAFEAYLYNDQEMPPYGCGIRLEIPRFYASIPE